MSLFQLKSNYRPTGDQPKAIADLVKGFEAGKEHQVLLGVTGSGKTFTMANVIQELQRPTLILAHNKTLAAQLFAEFKELFPHNAVEYFISYYDYYQPEAYIVNTDTYIEKDSSINDDIDKMRHAATSSLLQREDVIVVSSVSCIYGIGSPEIYKKMTVYIEEGMTFDRDLFLQELIAIQYERSDIDFHRGTFRVRGDTVDIIPASQQKEALRIEFFGDEIDSIVVFDPLTGEIQAKPGRYTIFPGSHYVTEADRISSIIHEIEGDLQSQLHHFRNEKKHVEYQRLETRTLHDIEMLQEIGHCPGIENYSRYLTGRPTGAPPPTLLEYFPSNFLLFVDESHVTIPQVGAMYRGDRSRKENLVNFGFRLPSALDNRPLTFDEFSAKLNQSLYVSATPGKYEMDKTEGEFTDQVIRPTGLLDPEISVRPVSNQVEDLHHEITKVLKREECVLVTTLTKRMAEELTTYFQNKDIKCEYLHSEVKTIERVEIIRRLRLRETEVLIGVNLLREGLDLPEVSLVAVLDADKEGFLRSTSSLIQTAGRAARNINGHVIFYADRITGSMQNCLDETIRRRTIQQKYNQDHGITPKGIKKEIGKDLKEIYNLTDLPLPDGDIPANVQLDDLISYKSPAEIKKKIKQVEKAMKKAANELDFETAASLRDELFVLKKIELQFL